MKKYRGMTFGLFLAIVSFALVFLFTSTVLAEFPTQPIKIICGFRAGGGTDTMSRLLAKPLGKILGKPVAVVNKPGAAGGVAATIVKNCKPDGHTLCATTLLTYSFMPNFSKKIKYTKEDFTYIAALGKFQEAFVCSSDKPWKDFKDLVEWAKAHPETTLTYATVTPIEKLFLKYIGEKEGVKFNAVPVKGGPGLVSAVLGHHVDFAFSGGIHYQYVKAGQMRVLCGLPKERLTATPDVPALLEFGYPLRWDNCFMVSAPKDLPAPVLKKLAVAFKKAAEDSDYQKLLMEKLHYPAIYMGPQKIGKYVDESFEYYKNLIQTIKK